MDESLHRRLPLALIAVLGLLSLTACSSGQGGSSGQAARPAAACPSLASTTSATYTAQGDHFALDGVDVTAVASLDANYGVNGTIDVEVTVACPTAVSDVSVFQSYEAFGSTVGAHLSEIAHSGNTWSFALFADNLSGQQPFEVALYQGALSGSGQPALATIVFKWPAALVRHMAS